MYSQWLIGSLCNVVTQISVVCRQIGSVDRAVVVVVVVVCVPCELAGRCGW